jgi:NodT family efflux transporter outer membrane factor (OMF) lipoprotein
MIIKPRQLGRVTLAAAMGAVLMAGCSFEPPLHVPKPPKTDTYTAGTHVLKTVGVGKVGEAGKVQQFVYGQAAMADWWHLFGSKKINRLVLLAVKQSPTLQTAQATLAEAHENLLSVQGVFWPQIGLDFNPERQRQSGAAFGGPTRTFSLYTGQVQVSYTPDFFGLNSLVSKVAKAQEQIQRNNVQEAYLTLEGNTVAAAIELASLNEQVRVRQALINSQEHILNIIKSQYKLGAVTYLDLVNQESTLASTQAQMPVLRQSLALERHALATLLGRIPSQAKLPELNLRTLKLPQTLPVSLPSSLVRQRPDIRSAEDQLVALNAQVGEAVAKMYPLVQITGDLGFENGRMANFFDASSLIWTLAANATVTLFDGGTLRANKRAAQDALKAQIGAYQQTVLNAFQQVADALRAVQHDAQTLAYDQAAYHAARQSYELAGDQYKDGAIDYITLLTSQTQYDTSRLALVSAEAQRYVDTVALFVALGGGWWPSQYGPTASPHSTTQPHQQMSNSKPASGRTLHP